MGRHEGFKGESAGLITREELGPLLRNLDLKVAKTATLLRWVLFEGLVICLLLARIMLG